MIPLTFVRHYRSNLLARFLVVEFKRLVALLNRLPSLPGKLKRRDLEVVRCRRADDALASWDPGGGRRQLKRRALSLLDDRVLLLGRLRFRREEIL